MGSLKSIARTSRVRREGNLPVGAKVSKKSFPKV
jgi:hypothetical protein